MQRTAFWRLSAALLLSGLLATGPMVGSAQDAPVTCPADTIVPDDDFTSGGLGLTCVEMESLYGPGQVGQSSIFYEVNDFDVHVARGGLSISWPRQSETGGIAEGVAREFAQQLLPEDAESHGSLNLGGVLFPFTKLELFESDDLEDRFEELNEPYSGEFVVVLTFAAEGMDRGDVIGIEIMPSSTHDD